MKLINGYITYLGKKYSEMNNSEKTEFKKHLKKIKSAYYEKTHNN